VAEIAARLGVTVPQVIFRFAQTVGILPLTGTSDRVHMLEDLACDGIDLTADDIAVIERA
jgi:diketogulonate reductase-like aldo/keto reductase